MWENLGLIKHPQNITNELLLSLWNNLVLLDLFIFLTSERFLKFKLLSTITLELLFCLKLHLHNYQIKKCQIFEFFDMNTQKFFFSFFFVISFQWRKLITEFLLLMDISWIKNAHLLTTTVCIKLIWTLLFYNISSEVCC